MWQRRISEHQFVRLQCISLVLFITFITAFQESNHPHRKQVQGPHNGVLGCPLLVIRENNKLTVFKNTKQPLNF